MKVPGYILALVMTLLAILSGGHLNADGRNPAEIAYFLNKESGRYPAALDTLREWCLSTEDPAILEINLFRIMELLRCAEHAAHGAALFEELMSKKADTLPVGVRDRLRQFISRLYLRSGRSAEAAGITDSFHFLGFQAIGPFSNGGPEDFSTRNGPANEFNPRKAYRGKITSVSWFAVRPDLTGSIDFTELLPDIHNSAFYLRTEIFVPEDGKYRFVLGKTGFLDLRVDGKLLFSSRERHGFLNDQYFITARLSKGRHSLVIKTGDSRGEMKISLRITDSSGAPINPRKKTPGADAVCEPISASMTPQLESLITKKSLTPSESFTAGYLLSMTRLMDLENPGLYQYFLDSSSDRTYASSANYYLSLMEKIPEKKDYYLKQSLKHNPVNVESLFQSAILRVRHQYFYSAFPFIEEQKGAGASPYFYNRCLANYLLARNWDEEALKHVAALRDASYVSVSQDIGARIKIRAGEHSAAADILKSRMDGSPFRRRTTWTLSTCLARAGRGPEAVNVLLASSRLHPNDVRILLRIAEISEDTNSVEAAMPYLISAEKLSPYHPLVLERMGRACYRLGKNDLASWYISRALAHDPGRQELRIFQENINRRKDTLDGQLYRGDIQELSRKADSFRDEAAVILLSETALRVNADGSSEKHVRRIVRINDSSAIRDFKTQFIILDPSFETIESFNCEIITPSGRIPITKRYRRSLSDPESRLYYDTAAEVIPLNSLHQGVLFDLSYRVRTRDRKDYKNYFGERIIMGDRYRTLLSRAVLIHPEGKKINYHPRGIPEGALARDNRQGNRFLVINLDNLPPYKKEIAMIHPSEFLPTIYFTTFQSWDDMVSWYRPFLKNRLRMSPLMKTKAAELTEDAPTDIEKVERIYRHITGEIRYVGLELGIGGIQPRNTESTYSSKLGDCKDVALLLAAFLRHAGIDANMALVRTRDRGSAWLKAPFMGDFNHAICSAVIRDASGKKRLIFLDGTSKHAGVRELPSDDRAVTALIIDERSGRWSFTNTESKFYHDDFVSVSDEITLLPDGGSAVRRTIAKKGAVAPYARENLADLRKQKIVLTEYWNDLFPGSSVEDISVKSLDQTKPVSYFYSVRVPSFAQITGDNLVFGAFINQSSFYSNYAYLSRRRFPISMGGPGIIKTRIVYRIPEGYSLSRLPANEKYRGDSFNADFQYRGEKGRIEVISKIAINTYRVNTEHYGRFRDFAEFVNRKELEKIILVRNPRPTRKDGHTP